MCEPWLSQLVSPLLWLDATSSPETSSWKVNKSMSTSALHRKNLGSNVKFEGQYRVNLRPQWWNPSDRQKWSWSFKPSLLSFPWLLGINFIPLFYSTAIFNPLVFSVISSAWCRYISKCDRTWHSPWDCDDHSYCAAEPRVGPCMTRSPLNIFHGRIHSHFGNFRKRLLLTILEAP